MQGVALAQMERLRAQIARIEQRPLLAESPSAPVEDSPVALLNAPGGILHEIFADEQRQSGAALGFALGMARRLLGPVRQAILYLQLATEGQEMGLPYGVGIRQFGLDPETLVIGRVENPTELFWAMEEAIACRAVAAVIADVANAPTALDFTVTRRLSLRTVATGASAFFLRYGQEREATAAKLRWRLSSAPSGSPPFDPAAPGPPRFLVEVEKGRLGEGTVRAEGARMLLDWTEDGFVVVERGTRKQLPAYRRAALPRAHAAVLGDGLSQAG